MIIKNIFFLIAEHHNCFNAYVGDTASISVFRRFFYKKDICASLDSLNLFYVEMLDFALNKQR